MNRRALAPLLLSLVALGAVSWPLPARASRSMPAEGARYLIITPDAFYNAVLPLADWKNRKGMQAKVVKLSEIGGSQASLIRDYVREAYTTWELRPEYVVLVGDPDEIPMPMVEFLVWSDNYYTNVEGDFYNEMIPGRIPGDNPATIRTVVAKTLGYERYPYLADTLWFKKGTTVVREDGDADDSIYWYDAHLAARLMLRAGYVSVDSLSYFRGDTGTDVVEAINDGRSYVLYRGQGTCTWFPPMNPDPEQTHNGYRLPIMISATCDQVDPFSGSCVERWVKAGTPAEPEGAVGACGPTTAVTNRAYLRSAEAQGFLLGLFATDSIYTLGRACEAARFNVYHEYGTLSEYDGFNCIGDPELNMWTTTPETLQVSYPPSVEIGTPSTFTVTVTHNSTPVAEALACVMMDVDSTVYAYGYTDQSGTVSFTVTPQVLDTLWVTATARNFLPHEGHALVTSEAAFVSYQSQSTTDTLGGNGDGTTNPGETIRMLVTLKNLGGLTAPGVQATLRTTDRWATIGDSTQEFGDMLPGGEATSANPFVFTVSPACSSGHPLSFSLHIWDQNSNTWDDDLSVPVSTTRLVCESYRISDPPPGGNGDGIWTRARPFLSQ